MKTDIFTPEFVPCGPLAKIKDNHRPGDNTIGGYLSSWVGSYSLFLSRCKIYSYNQGPGLYVGRLYSDCDGNKKFIGVSLKAFTNNIHDPSVSTVLEPKQFYPIHATFYDRLLRLPSAILAADLVHKTPPNHRYETTS